MNDKPSTMVRIDQTIYEDVRQEATAEKPRKRTITDMTNVLLAEALAARKAKKKVKA